jgi:hypothetical protein
MFVVQISLLIVTFLSLISQNLSLMQTTKEVNSHPRIAPCVNMWSATFLFLFFFFMPFVECWCMHMPYRPVKPNEMDHTTPLISHATLNLWYHTSMLTIAKLRNITCTLVATGVILRSLECTDLPSSKSHTLSMHMFIIFKLPCLQIMPEVLKSTKSFQVNPQQGDFLRSTLYNISHNAAQSGNLSVRDLRFHLWVATMRCRLHLEKVEDEDTRRLQIWRWFPARLPKVSRFKTRRRDKVCVCVCVHLSSPTGSQLSERLCNSQRPKNKGIVWRDAPNLTLLRTQLML